MIPMVFWASLPPWPSEYSAAETNWSERKLLSTVTNHPFEVGGIVRVDEKANALYYMARDGENHMKLQLHRVGLDGKGDRRLTDPTLNHAVTFSPDGRYFVDVAQTHDKPPVTVLATADGKQVAELARSDVAKHEQLGLEPAELYTFTAADGKTQLHALLQKPSNFDSTKKYPVLVTVYGGPATNGARETFTVRKQSFGVGVERTFPST